MKLISRLFISGLCLTLFITACAPRSVIISETTLASDPQVNVTVPKLILSLPPSGSGLWIDPSVPNPLRFAVQAWKLPPARNANSAATIVTIVQPGPSDQSTWVYALVAPFPTITDEVSSYEIRSAWSGKPSKTFSGHPLLMDKPTLAAFTALWGVPASGSVKSVPANQLLQKAWDEMPAWAIVPFEALDPKWKVLIVDGQSPIHKDFDASKYPLLAGFRVLSADSTLTLPATNRDPSKMTTVLMTGVTALVRATAKTMELKGVTYPGRDIRDWMREADIAHVSNEIPFYTPCSPPNPSRTKLIFCSSPRYMELLTDVGTDVIELTGNHFGDYGPVAMLETLKIYKDNGIPYYGGGADLADARKPLTLEDHGNKIAFVGCNPVDVANFEVAAPNRPGANPCDMKLQAAQIRDLRARGYTVIATFQYYEYYSPDARPWQADDFRLMADSGASIVSGSQAHFAQVMEFRNGGFIHYGLGNLFFDQMGDIPIQPGIRREFLDRHVIYNGRYISTELLTAMLEDYARPRPMTLEERAGFLQEYFSFSGWLPSIPTPTPGPTMTLTPFTLPSGTSNGSPPQTATPIP